MNLWYRIRRQLLIWHYRKWPPSLADAYKTMRILNPGCRLVYYALYADGCYTHGMCNSVGYFEGSGGPKHAPHLSFVPGDIPVYEWGISGLKYGDEMTKTQLQKVDFLTHND